jgi:signal transduction histidine kinase
MQREVSNQRISLRLKLASELPPVLGDRVQLQQVLINLVVNGIQAMADIGDDARDLLIESRRDNDGHVVVAVQDSGPGIDPENANRLFDAFFTTKADGMGMGLSICRSIIEARGRRVWATPNLPRAPPFSSPYPIRGRSRPKHAPPRGASLRLASDEKAADRPRALPRAWRVGQM